MPSIELSRFYPADPDAVFRVLVAAVQARARYQSSDRFSRAVSFVTKATAFASGANVSAYVVPRDGGSLVRVEGQAKMRSQVNANNAAHKQLAAVMDEVGRVLAAG